MQWERVLNNYNQLINYMQSEKIAQFSSQTDFRSMIDTSFDQEFKEFNKLNITSYPSPNPQAQLSPKSRSWKTNTISGQISFGKTLLDYHKEVIRKNVQNFQESLKLLIEEDDFLIFSVKSKDNLKILIAQNPLLHEKQRILYIKQLECEELFQKILQFTVSLLSQDFAYQIIYFAYLVWEKYIQIRRKYMEEQELLAHAQIFISDNFQKIYLDHRIKILFGRQFLLNSESILKLSKNLLRVLTETFLLVIEGFAFNPNSQTDVLGKLKMSAAPFQLYNVYDDEDSDSSQETQNCQHAKKRKL